MVVVIQYCVLISLRKNIYIYINKICIYKYICKIFSCNAQTLHKTIGVSNKTEIFAANVTPVLNTLHWN